MRTLQTMAAIAAFWIAAATGYGQAFAPTDGTASPDGTGNSATAAAAADSPIDISEAAGSLTDPTDFIYLSQDGVFSLLVLASRLNVPGVIYEPSALPRSRRVSPRASTRGRREGGATEMSWRGDSTPRGRRTVAAARYLAGAEDERRAARPPSARGHSGWLETVSVSGNEELAKLLDLVQDLPGWQRVGRFPLPTTEKRKIDDAVAGIYALAYSVAAQRTQPPQPEYSDDPQPAAGPPSPDPMAVGRWYYHYQQTIAWERYVSEEVLRLRTADDAGSYNFETAVAPQDLYLVPRPPDAPLPVIHFDGKESEVATYLSAVRPHAAGAAADQMYHVMESWAERKAARDSDESRNIVARLDERKQRRFQYRQWLDDRATDIRKLAEAYHRRLTGRRVDVDGTEILITPQPMSNIPLNAINVVSDKLTPYDLIDHEGRLKKPSEKRSE